MLTRYAFLPLLLALALSGFVRAAEDKPSEAKSAEAKPADNKSEAKPAAVSEEAAKKAEEAFEAGRKLFFQGNYADAIKELTSAAKGNPEKTSYKLLLAKAYRYQNQPKEAIAIFEEVLKANADHVEAGIELCELLSPQKEPDRVIAVLEPLLKFKHDYPLFHLLAEAYKQKEQFDLARKNYEEAIQLNPRSPEDHFQLGDIYLLQNHFAKAAQAYETAGSLGYDSKFYHFKLASVYFNLHNYLGGINTAEVLGGKAGQIKNDLFLIEAVPGKKDQFYVASPRSAIYQVTRAQELGIKTFQIRFMEANIWLSARRFAQADPIYKELEKDVKPDDAGLFWFYWSSTALGLEDYKNYLDRLNKAIVAEPNVYKPTLADAYVTVANRHYQRGETKQYIEFLGKAVETNPLSAKLHLTLGDAYWLENNRPKSLEQYKLVLELEPDHPQRVKLLNRLHGQEESEGPVAGK